MVIREAKRSNLIYRPHAFRSLGEFAKMRDDLDMIPVAVEVVSKVVDELTSGSVQKMEIDSRHNLAPK